MTKNLGREPNKWEVHHFANVGTGEPFVQGMLDLDPVVGACRFSESECKEVKETINSVLIDGLMPAFLELRQIRESVSNTTMPVLDRLQLYEDLGRKLWKAYKDLTEKAARAIGFKIGFLYDDEKKFQEGLKEFREKNPRLREGFEKFLESTRKEWQNDLAKFRNTWLEHQRGDREPFKKFYQPQYAEYLFEAVWRTIADILPPLLELRLTEGVRLVEQDPNDSGPRWAQRFRYDHPAFRNLK
jgi:hypothetical protein